MDSDVKLDRGVKIWSGFSLGYIMGIYSKIKMKICTINQSILLLSPTTIQTIIIDVFLVDHGDEISVFESAKKLTRTKIKKKSFGKKKKKTQIIIQKCAKRFINCSISPYQSDLTGTITSKHFSTLFSISSVSKKMKFDSTSF
jgi:hypothetical protein